jgi:hypothetical protein
VAAVVAVASSTACSAIVLRPLDARLHQRRDEPTCAAWLLAPTADIALSVYPWLVALVGLAFDEPLLSLGGAVVGGSFTVSAVYGLTATARCANRGEGPAHPAELERDDARNLVDDALPAFVTCGPIAAPIRVAFAVNPAGRVVRTHVYPPADPAIAACVSTVAERIAFPASASGLIFSHELSW